VKLRATDTRGTHARAVEDAGARLRELRHEEWQDFALAGLTFGLAMAATELVPQIAVPLLVGGLAPAVLGMRALWRRWDFVDRLAGERDAHTIPEVAAYALRETTVEKRRMFAALIRSRLGQAGNDDLRESDGPAAELVALARELEDEDLELDPASAIACLRLVSEPTESPLLNPAMPRENLRSSAHRIRSGFTARQRAC
jgi:hypothetical protein